MNPLTPSVYLAQPQSSNSSLTGEAALDISDPASIRSLLLEMMNKKDSESLHLFITKYPGLFAEALHSVSREVRSTIVNRLISLLADWQFSFFTYTTRFFDIFPFSRASIRRLSICEVHSDLIQALPQESCFISNWISICTSNMTYPQWAYFLISLDALQRSSAIETAIVNTELGISNEELNFCLRSILDLKADFPDAVNETLRSLIAAFATKELLSRIVSALLCLSNKEQEALLHIQPHSLVASFLKEKHLQKKQLPVALFSGWFDSLMSRHGTTAERRSIVSLFLGNLTREELVPFVSALNARSSPFGLYLVVYSLDLGKTPLFLQKGEGALSISMRSQLLGLARADCYSLNLLSLIQENSKFRADLLRVVLDMENAAVPVEKDRPMKFSDCLNYLASICSCDSSVLDYHLPFIHKIPPALVGLAAQEEMHKPLLLSFIPYLSEPQFQFLALSLSLKEFLDIETCSQSSIKTSHYQTLFAVWPSSLLISYVKTKSVYLQSASELFQENWKILLSDIEKKKSASSISAEELCDMDQKLLALQSLAKRANCMSCLCLKSNLLSRQELLSDETVVQFLFYQKNLEAKMASVIGSTAPIFFLIDDLRQKASVPSEAESTDLTQTLHSFHWTYIREGNLAYLGISPHSSLGITHAGELTLLGIQADEDLACIGCSLQQQQKIEAIVSWLEARIETKKGDPKSSFRTQWNACIANRESEAAHRSFQELAESIHQALKLKGLSLDFLEQFALRLKEFELLTPQERSSIEALIKSCSSQKRKKPKTEDLLEIRQFGELLFSLRCQLPLFCLQRYLLSNKDLKKTWEDLHKQGFLSLSIFFEAGGTAAKRQLLGWVY